MSDGPRGNQGNQGNQGPQGIQGIQGDVVDLSRLTQSIDTFTVEVGQLRQDNAAEKEANDRRIKVGKWAIGAALLVALLGVVVGLQARSAIDQVKATRAEARVGSCQKDNSDRIPQHNRLANAGQAIQNEIQAILNVRPIPPPSPDEDPIITEFRRVIAEQSALVNEGLTASIVPLRDCSLAGISAYLSTTTTAPP